MTVLQRDTLNPHVLISDYSKFADCLSLQLYQTLTTLYVTFKDYDHRQT